MTSLGPLPRHLDALDYWQLVELHRQLDQDLGRLERAWRAYQHRWPRPALAPTPAQLPHFQLAHGELQLALI